MKTIAVLIQENKQYKETTIEKIVERLNFDGFEVVFPNDVNDLLATIEQNPRVQGVVLDWDTISLEVAQQVHALNDYLPLFVFAKEHTTADIDFADLGANLHFFEFVSSAADDIAEKMEKIVAQYVDQIMPPFTKALFDYASKANYTFCTPGHMGGKAFNKSPAGSVFFDFFGENVFKADLSVSMPELGSLLDHSGVHADAEEYIAKTFNADHSYIVTNGTSTANKIVGMFSATSGSTIIMDRNCHKSLTHFLMMSDVKPVYFRPTRNAYGILGGIPRSEFSKEAIAEKISKVDGATDPCYAVVTNSTYDGLFYNTEFIKDTLETKYIHFDSAWVPYTNFSPIYEGKCGMSGDARPGKIYYETQSTHKLLAAFSQSTMLHIKGDINKETFNEAYMMHTTTSPQYNLVASTETAAAMMRGNAGKRLMEQSIDRAISFRKKVVEMGEKADGWFFKVWQPEDISTKECWKLDPKDTWHGFKDIDDDHMYLDPIKVTILTKGLDVNGKMEETGIPASILSNYLNERGIVVEKTGPYNILFLFSIGVDETQSLQLLRGLADFKKAFDENQLVKDMLPSIYANDPSFYEGMSVQELAQGIHELTKKHDLPKLMFEAFDVLPEMTMTPYEAWQQELKGNVEEIKLNDVIGRINANMILPYPPGVPVVLPGETITEESRPVLEFLIMLCEIGAHYPGFETDIHGAYPQEDGSYTVKVLKK